MLAGLLVAQNVVETKHKYLITAYISRPSTKTEKFVNLFSYVDKYEMN